MSVSLLVLSPIWGHQNIPFNSDGEIYFSKMMIKEKMQPSIPLVGSGHFGNAESGMSFHDFQPCGFTFDDGTELRDRIAFN
ncbi:hypothetical protein BLOT_011070 [Blomia tropicalis]|nr:hypothetical protein BLOT_011070 [Blomia tropicalis]